MRLSTLLFVLAVETVWALSMMGATTQVPAKGPGKVPFGTTTDGAKMESYILKNKHGLEADVTNFGATLVNLKTPDRDGKIADIVLGHDTGPEYENGNGYYGGTIGRYANRIAHGTFPLDGVTYHLATGKSGNALHGGVRGFNKVIWTAKPISSQSVEFTYLSKDGEESYPGSLTVKVTYTVTDKNELKIDYLAALAPGKDTILNLTNHSYFNLTGNPANNILQHTLTLYASHFTPTDSGLIPIGEIRSVKGTPFDFTTATPIGARIDQDDEQLRFAKGYDNNFVIDRSGKGMAKAAEVYEPINGRVMSVYTTEPGIQFYSGSLVNGTQTGKGGQPYVSRAAFCLETQHFPDSPNHPNFPTTTLKAGETYKSTTVYQFSVR